jgi:hypothetical protein
VTKDSLHGVACLSLCCQPCEPLKLFGCHKWPLLFSVIRRCDTIFLEFYGK